MLWEEIKRGFSRLSFLIVFMLVLIVCTVSAFKAPAYISLEDILHGYILTPHDGFIIFNPSSIGATLIIIMPLLSSLCYSDTYCEDLSCGIIKNIYTRKEKKKYLITKYIANFIISGVAIAVPLVVNYIILILRYPNVKPNAILGPHTILSTQLFPNVYYEHPTLYIVLWIEIYFIYSGLFASIGLSLSALIKKKKIALFLPFILTLVALWTDEIFETIRINPIDFLNMGRRQSFTLIISEFVILTIISFILFFIGGQKSETF